MNFFDLASYLRRVTQVVAVHGDEHVVPCVCDTEGRAHLWVNCVKQMAICYRCGIRHGDAIGIVSQVGELDPIAATRLVRQAGGPLSNWHALRKQLSEDVELPGVRAPVAVQLPAEFEAIDSRSLLPPYAIGRGITRTVALAYGLGVCRRGFYRDRLIVPALDVRGRLRTFVARFMGCPPVGVPKVLYPKGSRTAQLLFGEREARGYDTVVIVEGVFDAMRTGPYAVALFGKHASAVQRQRLAALGEKRKLVVMLDADAADDARELTRMLANTHSGDVYWAKLPPGCKDPGECESAEIQAAIREAIPIGARRGHLLWRLGAQQSLAAPQKFTWNRRKRC